MLFSSPTFIFFFLPLVLAVYYLIKPFSGKNCWLLVASLLFYGWLAPIQLPILLASCLTNWLIGFAIGGGTPNIKKISLFVGVCLNISYLVFFKYWNFLLDNLEPGILKSWASTIPASTFLPLGISFFSFHAISYLIDLYRKNNKPMMNPVNFFLYIAFFPQLVAGPIVRFKDIAEQFSNRQETLRRFSLGCERFIFGLGKKILIADVLAEPADHIFRLPISQFSTSHAWLALGCYSLQIYFDFSGYSDMAIGLSRMFGFEISENFYYPYNAKSLREFWHRWHISLSTWFRDYLYIPLGGGRVALAQRFFNQIMVFGLCGIWHGASWTFLAWGMMHGFFLLFEKGLSDFNFLRIPDFIKNIYVVLIVTLSWVFFRSPNMPYALDFFSVLFGAKTGDPLGLGFGLFFTPRLITTACVAAICAFPTFLWLSRDITMRKFPQSVSSNWIEPRSSPLNPHQTRVARGVSLLLIFILSTIYLSGNTYTPFIYFQF